MKKTLAMIAAEAAKFCRISRHDEKGFEQPDPTPVEMPLGFKRPLTLQEQIQRALQTERIMAGQRARGEETLEDSMDFDVAEDPDVLPATVHEVRDMAEETLAEGAAEYARQERKKALQQKQPEKAVEPQPEKKEPAKEPSGKSETPPQ